MRPSDMLTLIKDQLNNLSTDSFYTDSVLYDYMEQASRIISNRFTLNESKSTINSVANQREYDMPSGCVNIIRVTYDSYPLKRININGIDRYEGYAYGGGATTYGNTQFYYEYGNTLGLSPIPDSSDKNIDVYYQGETSYTSPDQSEKTLTLVDVQQNMNSGWYQLSATNMASSPLDGTYGANILPNETTALVSDAEFYVNGICYSPNKITKSDSSVLTIDDSNDGFSLDFSQNSDYVLIKWNNLDASGGFNLQNTDECIFKYYTYSTSSAPFSTNTWTIPDQYVYPIEHWVLSKCYARDSMFQQSRYHYDLFRIEMNELKDIKFLEERSRTTSLNYNNPIAFDCGLDVRTY